MKLREAYSAWLTQYREALAFDRKYNEAVTINESIDKARKAAVVGQMFERASTILATKEPTRRGKRTVIHNIGTRTEPRIITIFGSSSNGDRPKVIHMKTDKGTIVLQNLGVDPTARIRRRRSIGYSSLNGQESDVLGLIERVKSDLVPKGHKHS